MYIELVGPIQTPCALWFSGPKPMYLLWIKTNSTCIYIYVYIFYYILNIYIYDQYNNNTNNNNNTYIYILNWWVQIERLVHYGLVGPNPFTY